MLMPAGKVDSRESDEMPVLIVRASRDVTADPKHSAVRESRGMDVPAVADETRAAACRESSKIHSSSAAQQTPNAVNTAKEYFCGSWQLSSSSSSRGAYSNPSPCTDARENNSLYRQVSIPRPSHTPETRGQADPRRTSGASSVIVRGGREGHSIRERRSAKAFSAMPSTFW